MGSKEGRTKLAKKGKKCKNYFLFCFRQISRCVTCFYVHDSRAVQKFSFKAVALCQKKVPEY